MRDATLEEVQAELKKSYDEIVRQIERVAAISRELTESEPPAEPFKALSPKRFVADGLRELDEDATLPEYLLHLRRLTEMSAEEMGDEWNRFRWQKLVDVSNQASRGLNEIGDLLSQACSAENAIGLASLFRGVHHIATGYVVLAERLEAHVQAQLCLDPQSPREETVPS